MKTVFRQLSATIRQVLHTKLKISAKVKKKFFIVDGSRRLKTIETGLPLMSIIQEKYDVQAAFPYIMKKFVVDIKIAIGEE